MSVLISQSESTKRGWYLLSLLFHLSHFLLSSVKSCRDVEPVCLRQLVIGSFFYTSITFNTTEVAENVQKRWGYIPGIRPGKETASFLQNVSDRLNLFGGGFLALIAIFPYVITKLNNQFAIFPAGTSQIDFLISGSGLIIVVGVILDIIRRIDTDMKSFDYKKFY